MLVELSNANDLLADHIRIKHPNVNNEGGVEKHEFDCTRSLSEDVFGDKHCEHGDVNNPNRTISEIMRFLI